MCVCVCVTVLGEGSRVNSHCPVLTNLRAGEMLATGEHLGWRLRLLLWQDWAVLHADTNLDRRSVLWQVRLLTHQVRPGLPLRGWCWDFW